MIIDNWGPTDYEEAVERQRVLVQERIEGRRPDTLIVTQHAPVYTVGSAPTQEEQRMLYAGELEGIPVISTRRGGGITYHGPGQCVLYPIVSLEASRDLHAYLRRLEQTCIAVLSDWRVQSQVRPGLTGIWIDQAKVAAIGIAVRRYVAYHGLAINNTNSLDPFFSITPCRIKQEQGSVTRLQDHVKPAPSDLHIAQAFSRKWSLFS